jgi:trehalose utilization protein
MSLERAKSFLERALNRRDSISARIRQAGSFATVQCRVLDISRKNVRLKVADSDNIPDSFLLSFSNGGPVYRASVTWRRGSEVGAEFSAGSPRPQ